MAHHLDTTGSKATTTAAKEASRLLSLPPEIRNRIYAELFSGIEDTHDSILQHCTPIGALQSHLGITQTSHQLREDSRRMLFETYVPQTHWIFESHGDHSALFRMLNFVRHLRLSDSCNMNVTLSITGIQENPVIEDSFVCHLMALCRQVCHRQEPSQSLADAFMGRLPDYGRFGTFGYYYRFPTVDCCFYVTRLSCHITTVDSFCLYGKLARLPWDDLDFGRISVSSNR